MDRERANLALAALGSATRLATLEQIVATGVDGAIPSRVADAIGVPRNLMSAHLMVLERAGLVVVERRGRNRLYRVEPRMVRDVAEFVASLAEGQASTS